MSGVNKDEILDRAKLEAAKWVEASPFNKVFDKKAVLKVLQERTYEGEPVVVRLVDYPEQVTDALREACEEYNKGPLNDEQEKELTKAHLCVWDYYLMAFYESAYTAAGLTHEFLEHSLFDAFKNGLGFIVNFGSVIVGLMLPEEAHRDEDGRIHNPSGPAIVWGPSKEYWWRGVRVEEDWIMRPQDINPVDILNEENVEKRRAGCEILGWAKILAKLDAKVVDTDRDPMVGSLLSVNLPDAPNSKFIRVMCGTGREFALPVPDSMKTAIEAQLWMWQLENTEVNELLVRSAMVNRT